MLFAFLGSIFKGPTSIALGVFICGLLLTSYHMANGGELRTSTIDSNGVAHKKLSILKKAGAEGWITGLAVGATTGAIAYITTTKINNVNMIWLAWIFFVLIVAGYVWLALVWYRIGERLGQGVCFALVAVLMALVAKTLVGIISAPWRNTPFSRMFCMLPWFLVIGLVTFMVLDVLSFRASEGNKDCQKLQTAVKIVALALAVVIFVLALAGCGGPEDESKEQQTGGGGEGTTQQTSWYKFYNLELQKDKDESNDFDFGPNPVSKSWKETNYDRNFRERLKNDPALGAGDMAWLDAIVGTRYLGEFYQSCKGDWAKTINAAKEAWMKDQGAYQQTLEAFFAFLDTGKVMIVEGGQDIEDQMYMNPYTPNRVPDVIVMKTDQKQGLFLIYTFTIKGNEFKVKYRINCGYQPTNVEEVMGITPQDKPNKPSGGKDDPTPSPDPDDPTPSPTKPDNPPSPTSPTTPTPTTKQKDPADDPVNNGNAQKGGGDNKSTDGSGEYQAQDPRTEKQDPAEVKPDTPTVVPEHKAEEQAGQIVDHGNKMDYAPDPVTDRGPVNSQKPVTSSNGDGEFVPD